MVATDTTRTTIFEVILLSHPRPESVAVLVVLPVGARIEVRFPDDGTCRDITELAADLLVEYLLRGDTAPSNTDAVEVARIELTGGSLDDVRLATVDTRSATIGEVPSERLLPLLGAAIAMAVTDAIAHEHVADQAPEPTPGGGAGV